MLRHLMICAAAAAVAVPAADFLVSDWDDLLASHNLGGYWYYVTDQSSQGQSRVISGDTLSSPAAIDTTSYAPGFGNAGHCMKMAFIFGAVKPTCGDSCFFDPEVALEAELNSDTMPWIDFTGSAGVTFQAKADKPMKVRFMASTSEVMDYAYYGSDLEIGTEWKQYTVALDSSATFAQPAWKTASVSFNKAAVTAFTLLASKENNPFDTGTLFVDDFKILNWEKPVGIRLQAARKAFAGPRATLSAGGSALRVEIPASHRGGGTVEAYSTAGVLLGRKQFAGGGTVVEFRAAPGTFRGKVALRVTGGTGVTPR